MRTDTINWDDMYFEILDSIRKRSKDPSTQVAALAAPQDRIGIMFGYNGMPTGYPEDEAIWQRPVKYDHVVHAEENVIVNAAKMGIRIGGWDWFCTAPCCHKCARLVVQSGAASITYKPWGLNPSSPLHDSVKLGLEIFKRAGIKTVVWNKE